MKKKTLNVHPGELLREEFLTPLGITAYRLAKGARLPHQRVNEILKERRGITAETDLPAHHHVGPGPRGGQCGHQTRWAGADHQHVAVARRAHSCSRRAMAASETGFAGARGANSGSPSPAFMWSAASGAQ